MEHGGRLLAARSRYPGAPEPFLDLSTGINPVPYPVPQLQPETLTRLPEPEALDALRAAAASAYGARAGAEVVAAPGTQSLIGLLPRLISTGEVAILGPTYGEHAHAWASAGHRVRETEAVAGLAGADVAVLCNPNNPDGRRWSVDALCDLARHVGRLVVDEAFADLEPEFESLVPALPDNAVVLRSFGKTYGLAGLRLGFAIAPPALAAQLAQTLGPWPVSGAAIAIGCRALADTDWRDAAAGWAADSCRRLDALLTRSGRSLLGGTRLFRLYATANAAADADLLGRAGILVRSFAADHDRLRFGLPGGETDWARLEAALTRP